MKMDQVRIELYYVEPPHRSACVPRTNVQLRFIIPEGKANVRNGWVSLIMSTCGNSSTPSETKWLYSRTERFGMMTYDTSLHL